MKPEAERILSDDSLALLHAGRTEQPHPQSQSALLSALGISSLNPPPGLSSSSPAASTGQAQSPNTGQQPPSAPLRSGIFTRPGTWLAGSIAALSIPAALLINQSVAPSQTSASSIPQQVPASALEQLDQTARPQPQPAAQAEPEPNTGVAPPKTAAAARTPIATTPAAPPAVRSTQSLNVELTQPQAPGLKEELNLIKRARAALSEGALVETERLLESYATSFAHPQLSAEAQLLVIRLRLQQGRREEALRLAEPLRAPDSPFRARLDALFSE